MEVGTQVGEATRLAVVQKKTWLEIEDIMAAKHAYKRQITDV